MLLTLINSKGRTGVITLLCRITDSPSITIRSTMRKFNPYRKLWESHFGPIPKDNLGRSYEIHHIDGDHTNNEISNLKLVTIQEHYDIHYQLCDWRSCVMIGLRLKLSPEEISKLNSLAAIKRVNSGIHPFLQGAGNIIRTCEHCGTAARSVNHARWHGNNCKHNPNKNSYQPLREKQKINFKENNPSKILIICEHCNKIICKANYVRWHGNNCKKRI